MRSAAVQGTANPGGSVGLPDIVDVRIFFWKRSLSAVDTPKVITFFSRSFQSNSSMFFLFGPCSNFSCHKDSFAVSIDGSIDPKFISLFWNCLERVDRWGIRRTSARMGREALNRQVYIFLEYLYAFAVKLVLPKFRFRFKLQHYSWKRHQKGMHGSIIWQPSHERRFH